MDAFTQLRKLFPQANTRTALKIIGPSQRIRINKTAVELQPYEVGDGEFIMAAFVPELNIIFMRFDAIMAPEEIPQNTDKKQ